ncbi:TPA: helix-turn-helix domain-containing protein [Streptococcus suis]|uniref:helix-turn-helix domain-containing protein n=2 Tax=Streptococcus suis TaxID=1307 RepID=UPI0004102EF5|nr:helix-turn-helix transcriptional regulator [Streptococcus suis]MBS8080470.1 helix-turn-helix transcriptional regulator [Streptococcus suis]MCB2923478.1 helix-turn-helix transcriptional regulator [Streptococcus suis]MCB2927607.1 helix-turn-helix transcriptional regulator [Streptococcus suis]MCG9906260.1 helix-turn-helix transcriptional regulator [Streptococcus suis]MCK3966157.1 helix-turn-helix transcriptional regulator [Streptococcus suis]
MTRNIERIRKEKNVSLVEIADLLGVKSQTVREKIDGTRDFKFGEALLIQTTFFKEYDMIYLFDDSECHTQT